MKTALRHFMTGLIDYAGLFPPAALPVDRAVENHTRNTAGEYGWMLNRFIVPSMFLDSVPADLGFHYSVLISIKPTEEELKQLREFKGTIQLVESRFATDNDPTPARQLTDLQSLLRQTGLQDIQLFIEADNLQAISSALATLNPVHVKDSTALKTGFKLRCGGLEKNIPSTATIASVIEGCIYHDIPIKFTAGLHQPMSHQTPEHGVMQYGFVNIFGAALLAWSGCISGTAIAECLIDMEPDHFHFTDQGFGWKDSTISNATIHRLRTTRVISFGSCSFDEPVAGLKSLGLL